MPEADALKRTFWPICTSLAARRLRGALPTAVMVTPSATARSPAKAKVATLLTTLKVSPAVLKAAPVASVLSVTPSRLVSMAMLPVASRPVLVSKLASVLIV